MALIDTNTGELIPAYIFVSVLPYSGYAYVEAFLDQKIEARYEVASTIFCSQLDTPGWHENLYDPTVADAICDCIIYDAYRVKIEGESMRKRNVILN